jgi:hypothetical protein
MSVIELKEKIHRKIDEIEDEIILNNLFQITKSAAEVEVNYDVVQITEEERSAIEEGRRELNEGEAITFNDFKKKYPKWFTK